MQDVLAGFFDEVTQLCATCVEGPYEPGQRRSRRYAWTLPPVLVLSLGRCLYEAAGSKVLTRCRFPLAGLRVPTHDAAPAAPSYDLRAVIVRSCEIVLAQNSSHARSNQSAAATPSRP